MNEHDQIKVTLESIISLVQGLRQAAPKVSEDALTEHAVSACLKRVDSQLDDILSMVEDLC